MLSLFLMTGCSKETKFKSVDRTTTGFHKVNVAEKIDDGVLYFKGDKILYDKDGTVIKMGNLLELIESRTNKKSTIYCSQWTPSGWHEKLGGGAVADAILDRIVNSSYMIELKGNSLGEEYSKLK